MSNGLSLKNSKFAHFENFHADSFHHRETSAEDSDIAKKGHVVPTARRKIKAITAGMEMHIGFQTQSKQLYAKLHNGLSAAFTCDCFLQIISTTLDDMPKSSRRLKLQFLSKKKLKSMHLGTLAHQRCDAFAKLPHIIHPIPAHLKMPQIAPTLTSPSASPQASGIPMVAQNNPTAARANETNLGWKIFEKNLPHSMGVPKVSQKWNERIIGS